MSKINCDFHLCINNTGTQKENAYYGKCKLDIVHIVSGACNDLDEIEQDEGE